MTYLLTALLYLATAVSNAMVPIKPGECMDSKNFKMTAIKEIKVTGGYVPVFQNYKDGTSTGLIHTKQERIPARIQFASRKVMAAASESVVVDMWEECK